jgi:hypothetical protein
MPLGAENSAFVIVNDGACPQGTDLSVVQAVIGALATMEVNTPDLFIVDKDLDNAGDVVGNAILTSTGDIDATPPASPTDCTLTYTAIGASGSFGAETITIAAGVTYSGDLGAGVGPAVLGPAAAGDDVTVVGAALFGEIVVTRDTGGFADPGHKDLVEDWTKECSEPSFHDFTIENEIVRDDPNSPADTDPGDNTASDNIPVAVEAHVNLSVNSVTVLGIDTNLDFTADGPIPPGIISDDGFGNLGTDLPILLRRKSKRPRACTVRTSPSAHLVPASFPRASPARRAAYRPTAR